MLLGVAKNNPCLIYQSIIFSLAFLPKVCVGMCCVKLWVSAYFLLKDNPIQNSRLFTIKRMSRVVSKDRVKKNFDRLYTSKLRYGLQLLGNVRLKNEDPKDGILKSLQITQNKAAKFLN